MRFKQSIIISLVVIGCLVGLVYILSNKPEVSQNNNQRDIKIGAVLSLTGDASAYGEYAKKGLELATNEINQKGGVEGRLVKLIIEDDKSSAKDAVSSFQKLVNVNKVDGVIGGVWDFLAQPLIPLAQEYKIVFISPSNFRIAGSFELNDYSFVMMTDFEYVLSQMNEYLEDSDTEKLAVVRFASAFGEQIIITLNELMRNLGREPVVDEEYVQIGGNDFRTVIAKLKQVQVDTVFLDMLDIDALTFLRQARELGFYPRIISHTLIADALALDDVDKTLLENVVVLNWEISNEPFKERFREYYGLMPAKSAQQNYEAVYILSEALAKSAGAMSVNSYIESQKFITSISQISFSENHNVLTVPVELQVIRDGKLEIY